MNQVFNFFADGFLSLSWQNFVMYGIGGVLIYLAIAKKYEPMLLLPIGFGTILVNIPFSGVVNQTIDGIGEVNGIVEWLYKIADKRTSGGKFMRFIFHAIGTIIFIVVAVIYCFAQ